MDLEDVIEAFVDGETVDPTQLKLALAEPQGRDLLVDLLVLRGLVGGWPGARPQAGDGKTTAGASRWRLLAAAAAIAGVGVFGGYLAGTRVIAPRAAVTTASRISSPAPAPTHVIRLENGVDWTERTGGH